MSREIKGFIYAILSAVTYGIVALFGKRITALGYSNETMLFWRFLISFGLLSLLMPRSVIAISSLKVKEGLLALLGFIISAYCFFESIRYIGTGLAMTIFFIYPAILAVLNLFLNKETLPLNQKIAMLLGFFSITLLSDFDIKGDLLYGLLYGITGGAGYALYTFYSRLTRLSAVTLTAWVCLFTSLCFLSVSFYTQTFKFINIAVIPDLTGMILISTLMSMLLFLKAIEYIGSIKASLLTIADPATTILLGVVLLNERFNHTQLIGLGFMAASMIFLQISFAKK